MRAEHKLMVDKQSEHAHTRMTRHASGTNNAHKQRHATEKEAIRDSG